MRGINHIKHAEFVHMLHYLVKVYQIENTNVDLNALRSSREKLEELHLQYEEKLSELTRIIAEYDQITAITKRDFVAKPSRQLKSLKKGDIDFKALVRMINILA